VSEVWVANASPVIVLAKAGHLQLLQRRLASSLAAIRLSLERRLKRLKDLQRLGKIKQEFGELPEDLDDLSEAERWQFEDDLVERVTMAENMAELEAEIEELDRLVKLARHTERHVPKATGSAQPVKARRNDRPAHTL
jgi:hypothetical protein